MINVIKKSFNMFHHDFSTMWLTKTCSFLSQDFGCLTVKRVFLQWYYSWWKTNFYWQVSDFWIPSIIYCHYFHLFSKHNLLSFYFQSLICIYNTFIYFHVWCNNEIHTFYLFIMFLRFFIKRLWCLINSLSIKYFKTCWWF